MVKSLTRIFNRVEEKAVGDITIKSIYKEEQRENLSEAQKKISVINAFNLKPMKKKRKYRKTFHEKMSNMQVTRKQNRSIADN